MQCPNCGVNFHEDWSEGGISNHGKYTGFGYRVTQCPSCQKYTIDIIKYKLIGISSIVDRYITVIPRARYRKGVSNDIPEDMRRVFIEAGDVLSISPKASAALSRRCLQDILRRNGYKAGSLASEIDLLLSEKDPKKAIPLALQDAVDAIRNFGNFSAHPVTDQTTLQIIDVEPHEAEWCLELIEEMFEHFYVKPAEIAKKKSALNAKLAAAGKPPSK